jgi:2-polyprenyl-3-methyl-5-hydroxy-6-metoxy-1,4-benzoquinol methylase
VGAVQNCPLCGGTSSTLFDQRTFREILVSNRLCHECGLVYQSPRMSDEELEAFYEQEYRQLYQNSQEPSPKDLAVQAGRAQSLVSFFAGAIRSSLSSERFTLRRHLDIGCSAGLLLQSFQHAYHCQPTGIEPGAAYRAYAQAQGLAVYASLKAYSHPDIPTSQPANLPTFQPFQPFDLISLAHVLEHLPNPTEYLASLRREWLTPDGKLLIEVPNLYCHDSFEVAHLISYSRHTLSQMLMQAGYTVVGTRLHGEPRSKLLPLYITMLASPNLNLSQAQVQPEKWVRLKRSYGLFHRQILSRLAPRQAWISTS